MFLPPGRYSRDLSYVLRPIAAARGPSGPVGNGDHVVRYKPLGRRPVTQMGDTSAHSPRYLTGSGQDASGLDDGGEQRGVETWADDFTASYADARGIANESSNSTIDALPQAGLVKLWTHHRRPTLASTIRSQRSMPSPLRQLAAGRQGIQEPAGAARVPPTDQDRSQYASGPGYVLDFPGASHAPAAHLSGRAPRCRGTTAG